MNDHFAIKNSYLLIVFASMLGSIISALLCKDLGNYLIVGFVVVIFFLNVFGSFRLFSNEMLLVYASVSISLFSYLNGTSYAEAFAVPVFVFLYFQMRLLFEASIQPWHLARLITEVFKILILLLVVEYVINLVAYLFGFNVFAVFSCGGSMTGWRELSSLLNRLLPEYNVFSLNSVFFKPQIANIISVISISWFLYANNYINEKRSNYVFIILSIIVFFLSLTLTGIIVSALVMGIYIYINIYNYIKNKIIAMNFILFFSVAFFAFIAIMLEITSSGLDGFLGKYVYSQIKYVFSVSFIDFMLGHSAPAVAEFGLLTFVSVYGFLNTVIFVYVFFVEPLRYINLYSNDYLMLIVLIAPLSLIHYRSFVMGSAVIFFVSMTAALAYVSRRSPGTSKDKVR